MELFSKPSDILRIEQIARKSFQYNYSSYFIENTTLQNNTWIVKGTVTLFTKQSSKTLVIDAKTGKIITCK
jgi:hypothetical protein